MRCITVKHGSKHRIYPNKGNRIYIHQTDGCVRKFYNERVAQIPDEQKEYFAYKDEHDDSPVGFKFHWITQKEMREKYPYMKVPDGLALSNAQQTKARRASRHSRRNRSSRAPSRQTTSASTARIPSTFMRTRQRDTVTCCISRRLTSTAETSRLTYINR